MCAFYVLWGRQGRKLGSKGGREVYGRWDFELAGRQGEIEKNFAVLHNIPQ